jgi:hypothetical protein
LKSGSGGADSRNRKRAEGNWDLNLTSRLKLGKISSAFAEDIINLSLHGCVHSIIMHAYFRSKLSRPGGHESTLGENKAKNPPLLLFPLQFGSSSNVCRPFWQCKTAILPSAVYLLGQRQKFTKVAAGCTSATVDKGGIIKG